MFLGYVGAHGNADRIEIDLNFLFRVPFAPLVRATLWQPGDLERPEVVMVAPEELAAGKLCALLDRCAPRDLFDAGLARRSLSTVLRSRRFRRLFIAIAGTLPHPVHRYGQDRLARITDRMVTQQLHPMLVQGDVPSADQLRRDAWQVLRPLLDLDPAEREFTDRLQAGELVPELLFPRDTKKMAALLRGHPALAWKASNARAANRGR